MRRPAPWETAARTPRWFEIFLTAKWAARFIAAQDCVPCILWPVTVFPVALVVAFASGLCGLLPALLVPNRWRK